MKKIIEEYFPRLAIILRKVKENTLNKIKIKKQQKILQEVGVEALENLKKTFEELDLTWFLAYGTLLGAYRENSFISHDVDIDIGVFHKDYTSKLEKTLRKNGFIKKHEFVVDNGTFAREETYEYKGIGVDIFYFKQTSTQLKGYGFINSPGRSWDSTIEIHGGLLVRELIFPYEGLDEIKFFRQRYPIPKNSKKHLSCHYGENFMQKDVKWDPNKVKNVQVLENKIGIMKIYGRK